MTGKPGKRRAESAAVFPPKPRFQTLRNLDQRLSRVGLYSRLIRPVMKRCWIRLRLAKQYRHMLRLEDKGFLTALYSTILRREPDPKGMQNHLSVLNGGKVSKKMLLSEFVNSEEARRIPVSQTDDFTTYLRRKFRRRARVRNRISRSARIIKPGRKHESVLKRLEILEEKLLQRERDAQRDKALIDSFYLSYNEKMMPDSREEVKKRAQVYIDKIEAWLGSRKKSGLSITDFGCGEGEWMELLQENGFAASGVDSNSKVIEKARKALPSAVIINDDALHFLLTKTKETMDIITAFHMAEHMDMLSLIKFLLECKRVLKPGGLLILETPNPQNILTATYYFYLDPTHNRPIPPELLEFYVKEAGFKVNERILLYPLDFCPYDYRRDDPIKDIVFRFNMEQAYGVLAVKES